MTSHRSTEAALPERAVRELAAAAAALVTDHDIIGSVTNLLTSSVECVGAGAGGIVLAGPDDRRLEFLAATDHRAEHIELYQVQIDAGPCADCIESGQGLTIKDLSELGSRWPALTDQFRAAGFTAVHAAPMTWHGETLGALNLFFRGEIESDPALVAQAFADMACVVIIQAGMLTPTQVLAQTRAALDERTVVEQAKGVLAYTHQLSMDSAYDHLVKLARDRGEPLTKIAAVIVAEAVNHQQQS
jgi:hypothetical protein